MRERLTQLGGFDEKGEPNWEKQYVDQLEMKRSLETKIKLLEKQNNNQAHSLEKAVNDDGGENKLKALNEELRVWKAKVAQLAMQLEKDQKTRNEQSSKTNKLQEENKKYESELVQLQQKDGPKLKQ